MCMRCPQLCWDLRLIVGMTLGWCKIQPCGDQSRTFSALGVTKYSQHKRSFASAELLSPVLWFQKNKTHVYAGVVWWVVWKKKVDFFLSLKVFCLLLMGKIKLYSNKASTIAKVFVLGQSLYSALVHFAFLLRILALLWLFVSLFWQRRLTKRLDTSSASVIH